MTVANLPHDHCGYKVHVTHFVYTTFTSSPTFNFSVVAMHTKVCKRPIHRLINCFSCCLYPFHGLTRLSLSLRL